MDDRPTMCGVCVARPDRFGLTQRAMLSFAAQDYEHKRLIVLTEDTEQHRRLSAFATDQGIDRVELWEPPPVPRRPWQHVSAAMERIRRDDGFLVGWDDDNTAVPEFMSHLAAMACRNHADAVLPVAAMLHFFDTDELFFHSRPSRFKLPSAGGFPCAAVCRASEAYFHFQMNPNRHPMDELLDHMHRRGKRLVRCSAQAWGYLKIGVRGDNLHGYEHYRAMAQDTTSLDAVSVKKRWDTLRHDCESHPLAGTRLWVCGHDSVAMEHAVGGSPLPVEPVGDPVDEVTRLTE